MLGVKWCGGCGKRHRQRQRARLASAARRAGRHMARLSGALVVRAVRDKGGQLAAGHKARLSQRSHSRWDLGICARCHGRWEVGWVVGPRAHESNRQ